MKLMMLLTLLTSTVAGCASQTIYRLDAGQVLVIDAKTHVISVGSGGIQRVWK